MSRLFRNGTGKSTGEKYGSLSGSIQACEKDEVGIRTSEAILRRKFTS